MPTNNFRRFDLFAPISKSADAGSKPTIRATASSDLPDLGQDRFAVSALLQMADQFPNRTLFIAHTYRPEDAAGTITAAKVDKVGNHHELVIDATLDVGSARVAEIWRQLQAGVRLGLSVGVIVRDATFEEENGVKTLVIREIEALEISIVGLSANREASWITAAFKAASFAASDMLTRGSGDEVDVSELGAAKAIVRTLLAGLRVAQGELTERDQLIAEMMVEVNKILDTPLPRKIADEETFTQIADRYEWLDPRIVAALARGRVE